MLPAAHPESPDRGVTLVVYHRTADVEQHIAPLRGVPGLRLIVVWQGTSWSLPPDVTGLLWELSPQDGADRRIADLVQRLPAASYSAGRPQPLVDLSRTLGFRQHLAAPLGLTDVERALGLPPIVDLADRLDTAAGRIGWLAGRTEVMGDLVRAVNSSTDPTAVASALITRVAEWLPLNAWSVLAVESDGMLRWLVSRDLDGSLRTAAESLADIVSQSGQAAIRVTSYVTERAAGSTPPGVSAEATVLGWPLTAAGTIVGVLVGFEHGRARRLPTMPQALADAVAMLVEPAAYALAQALRVSRAEALSVTDDLTQLYNSRYLSAALRKEAKRAIRSGWPLSLLFIDLDGFKRINDERGHLMGSRALIEAAAIIRGSARETDIVARFGGDEFAIVLPETGVEGARAVARRVRDRVARYAFLADRDAQGDRLTASIGVATLPDVAETAEGLLQAADAAMYYVKMQGKHGIHVAGRDREPAPPAPEAGQELA